MVVIAVNTYLSLKYIVVKTNQSDMVNLNQDKTRVKTVRMITFTFIPHNNQKVSRAGGAKSEIRVILIYK
ncbi:hypothetical protein PRABACTJOHN_03467 [Parabacteroides johnsonii DSM 18315]|uniref:Uncharacterized protein n=2 Tax=Parabacteroides johnsonii TaxID=387661 RepID=A0A9Q5SP91_9BACT|nr:hypothetical protein PRABACTJOHN_03467 [Parabacteroides johnsonii DSM 18315]OUO03278.1 hypothetical protein B5F96_16410 [Parabacteroides johnsonii]